MTAPYRHEVTDRSGRRRALCKKCLNRDIDVEGVAHNLPGLQQNVHQPVNTLHEVASFRYWFLQGTHPLIEDPQEVKSWKTYDNGRNSEYWRPLKACTA